MKRKSLIALLLCCLTWSALAQPFRVSGYVFDSISNEPLAFVNILVNDSKNGGMTDIDGFFNIEHPTGIVFLKLSYVGYNSCTFPVKQQKQQLIRMSSHTLDLPEIHIVAGGNPAHRIISNVIANREFNDPENIKSYSYTSYDKMIFTAIKDTIARSNNSFVDTNEVKLLKLVNQQHLFMMESVSEHKFLSPSRNYDEVTAMKVSGFSDPLFVFLLSHSQPTSFYKESISLAGKNFLNPIGKGFEKNYFFWIMDTLYNNNHGDSTFVISYKPLKGKNFDGLKGLLYISNNGWAIANVIAEPARTDEPFVIRIQQMYDLVDNKQWFPIQLNTDITFNHIELNSTKPMAMGKSYRENVKLEPNIVKDEFDNIAINVLPDAGLRDETYWNAYRNDTLTLIERNTYRVLDSLGKVHNLDGMGKMISSLSVGRLSIGVVDLDVNKIFRYNLYEKVYLGAGLYTNNNLSRFISIGGYTGYGFGDKAIKYGASLKLNLIKYNSLGFAMNYRNDIDESAGTHFFDDQAGLINELNFRNFYINRWDKVESLEIMSNFRVLKCITGAIGVSKVNKKSLYDYAWEQPKGDVSILTNAHSMGNIIAGLKFAWKERFARNKFDQVSMGTKFPILWLQITMSRNGFLAGGLNYNRLDMRSTWSVYNKLIGRTSFALLGGILDADAPFSELFNGRGSAGANFSLYAPTSFSTMKPAEFISDRYVSLFVLHDFGKLLLRTKLFDPEISVAVNIGTGQLQYPERHRYAEYRTMEKGFYEMGLIVNNIIKSSFSGIGIGAFYRMGPYSYAKPGENLVIRFTIKYSL